MRKIDFEEAVSRLDFQEAIEVMRQCFSDYGEGKISQNTRMVEILPDGKNKNVFAMMLLILVKIVILVQKSLLHFLIIIYKDYLHIWGKFYYLILKTVYL